MRLLDLFSGIGGMSLGLERAGMRTVAMCEVDPLCRRILAKHWPDVPIHGDVRELTADAVGPVDIIAGGFPCPAFSSAARGRNVAPSLWPEMFRIIGEVRPTWVLIENVTAFDNLALDCAINDLEGDNYEVGPPFEIPAGAVGKDHKRARLWLVGYSDRQGKSSRALNGKVARMSRYRNGTGSLGAAHGLSARLDRARLRVLGNAVVPQVVEQIGRAIMAAKVQIDA